MTFGSALATVTREVQAVDRIKGGLYTTDGIQGEIRMPQCRKSGQSFI